MRTPTPITDQIDATREDRLRVLIVGAGVAGITIAGLLRAEGLHPVVVDAADPEDDPGYMLALMPLVDPILARLDVARQYRHRSEELRAYRMRDRHGRLLHDYPADELLGMRADYRGIARGELLAVLSTGGVPVTFSTSVTALRQEGEHAVVTFNVDEAETEFALVIGADGLHSGIRELVLRPEQVSAFDSGWGGWVTWLDPVPGTEHVVDETWGAGYFMGNYPVKGRVGAFIGGERIDTGEGPAQFAETIRAGLEEIDERHERALRAVATEGSPYYWKLVDRRATVWAVGRVVLLGDAAAGFLPTAGVGAAMAMESAGVLAQHLTVAGRPDIPGVLRAYEAAQRRRVEAAQDNSRQLARLMFRRNRFVAAARDVVTRIMPLDMALGPIRRLHDGSPLAGGPSASQVETRA